jgi:hypothetical protein
MTPDLVNRFTYHPPDENRIKIYANLRSHFLALARRIDVMVPDSREKATALTHLQAACQWANAGVACNQVAEVLYLSDSLPPAASVRPRSTSITWTLSAS